MPSDIRTADKPNLTDDKAHEQAEAPYCGNCGYSLIGATESAKCPECGRPLVEVLQRRGQVFLGRRYQSKTRAFGKPLIAIAFGPKGNEKRGHAKGIIAIGDIATGWLAIGGFARGIIALGGFALGLLPFGGGAVGGLALGGGAMGLMASGGLAIGGFAFGGAAVGIVAEGGLAVGHIARGGAAIANHAITGAGSDPIAADVFAAIYSVVGGGAPGSFTLFGMPVATQTMIYLFHLAATLLIAGVLGCALLIGLERKRPGEPGSG